MRIGVRVAITAALLVTGASPAAAEVVRSVMFTPNRDIAMRGEVGRLYADIERARSTRAISRPEAKSLRYQVDQVNRLYRSYMPGGLTSAEVATLQAQIGRVRQTLRYY